MSASLVGVSSSATTRWSVGASTGSFSGVLAMMGGTVCFAWSRLAKKA